MRCDRSAWVVPGTLWIGSSSLSAEPSTAALLACLEITSSASRLACFDRAAAALSAISGPVVPATPAAPAAPAPATGQAQHFGLSEKAIAANEVAAGTRATDVPNIEAHIIGLSQAAGGRIVFELDNGQVWRQLEPERDMLAKAGDAATISRGWLGSYWLELKS